MNKLLELRFISVLLIFAFSPAQAPSLYVSADSFGSVTDTLHVSAEPGLPRTKDKDCNWCPEDAVSGHVLFDASLTPDAYSGIDNTPLFSILGASDSIIFSTPPGSAPLRFHFGGSNLDEERAIRFKRGAFNHFNFPETFFLNGNPFGFDIDGSAWDTKAANKNGTYSKVAPSGTVNGGSPELPNQEVPEPVSTSPAELPVRVPEPATLPLLGLGLAAMAFLNKKVRIKRLTVVESL